MTANYYVGLDVGSTTAKIFFTNHNNKVVFKKYRRHMADVLGTLGAVFAEAMETVGDVPVKITMTGSAGLGVAEKQNWDFIQEVVATSEVTKKHFPETRVLVDIGGEDGKMIFFEKDRQPDIRMNGSCAGGTGAFIDQMAALLNVPAESLNDLAEKSTTIYPIASRCGVFAKTDLQNLVSRKIPLADICMSVFHAVAIQNINALARGVDVTPKILFCGGPLTFFPRLRKAFMDCFELPKADMVLPENSEFFPAWGAALAAQTSEKPAVKLSNLIASIKKQAGEKFAVSGRLEPLFTSPNEYETWKKERKIKEVAVLKEGEHPALPLFIGVDSGSTTTKFVVMDANERLVFSCYGNNQGDPLGTVAKFMQAFSQNFDVRNWPVGGAAATGYGEDLIKTAFHMDHGIVETIAHHKAAARIDPNVSFLLDIGGQDMKAVFIEDGNIAHIEINEACSSGCGSFLQNFAESLGTNIEDFAAMACAAEAPCDLGTRCTVFMNSRVKQALRENASISDIAGGLAYSVIKNTLYKVLKLRDLSELGRNIVVQGGTFRNDAVYRTLEKLCGQRVSSSQVPELMGAYGAALFALERWQTGHKTRFDYFSKQNGEITYETKLTNCKGCTNNCVVTRFIFDGRNHFFSGNKCEKIFSNRGENRAKGVNLAEIKNNLVWNRASKHNVNAGLPKIGLPRILGLYEDYPFWHELLTACGLEVVVSDQSTMSLYRKGVGTIMADNICFPAKLAHGHVLNLIEKGVDRIFYPMTVRTPKEHPKATNSFNCPIVSGYSEVLTSAVNTALRFGVPLDYPTVVFDDQTLLRKACRQYLAELGVTGAVFEKAFEAALKEADAVKAEIRKQAENIYRKAKAQNRDVVMLAGRPYHIDPLIEHRTSQILADMDVDVITVDMMWNVFNDNFHNVVTIPQWSYPNRMFKTAQWAARQDYAKLHFVMLNSFGCGPDAFIMDEVKSLMGYAGKPFTLIKVDDITSTGSVRLRLRSLLESSQTRATATAFKPKPVLHTPLFQLEDRIRTILVPHFSNFYSPLIPSILARDGYKVEVLPPADTQSAEIGLIYANNEICYPATVVIGDLVKALLSGKYDLNTTAVCITQTGGQCRATNYVPILKKAIVDAGITNVPVISTAFAGGLFNEQPGFKLNLRKLLMPAFKGVLFTDAIASMYYSIAPRELKPGSAMQIRNHYVNMATRVFETEAKPDLKNVLREAVHAFNQVPCANHKLPVIGVVGEIFLKYNPFSQMDVVEWLIKQGVEVRVPALLDFFTQYFVNVKAHQKANLKRFNWKMALSGLFEGVANHHIQGYDAVLNKFRYYHAVDNIHEKAREAAQIIRLTNQFGEGWLIAGEVAAFAKEKINHVISLQPFGCIANHVISKGIEKRIKSHYPQMNLLFLDFDSNTSEVNVLNRLYFLIKSAREELDVSNANVS